MRRFAILLAALAAAVLALDAGAWLLLSHQEIGRADFTSTYVGATLLRQGHGGQLYDEGLQAPLHASLIAPDTEGNLPFVNPPAAAAVAVPVSLLDLDSAFRVWSLLQLGLCVAAVVIALRASPGVSRLAPATRWAIGLVALAGTGTLSLLVLGQWDGAVALGVAGAYAAWRRDHRGLAGAALAIGLGLAKPHLALGLAAWVIARRDRRLLAGAAAGTGALVAVALATAGPGGSAAFLHTAVASTDRWPLRSLLGFTGLFGSWLGDGALAGALAAAGSVAAVAACAVLGDAARRRPDRLEASLAGATALSLLASPHLLGQDLAVLAPCLAWCLAGVAARPGAAAFPDRLTLRVLLLWAVVVGAAFLDLGNQSPAPPGRLVPWALLGAGAAAWSACGLRRPSPAPAPGRSVA